MDVTDLSAVEKSIRLVLEKEGRIDVLINNAGTHTGGAIEVLPYEDIRLQMELKEFNINVLVINPGDFHTKNTINRRNVFKSESDNAYETQFTKTLSIIENDEYNGWEPEILARKLYKILDKERPANRYIIASFEQKLALVLKRILPGSLFEAILRGHYG